MKSKKMVSQDHDDRSVPNYAAFISYRWSPAERQAAKWLQDAYPFKDSACDARPIHKLDSIH
jgi:hypothetical protein